MSTNEALSKIAEMKAGLENGLGERKPLTMFTAVAGNWTQDDVRSLGWGILGRLPGSDKLVAVGKAWEKAQGRTSNAGFGNT